MVASYPGTIRVFTRKADLTDTVYADHPNSVQDEVVALENTLGVNPHLSTAPSPAGTFNAVSTLFSSVAARLANIETGVVGDAHTQYVRKTGGDVLQAGSLSTIGLRIRGASGQTADLLQFLSSGGSTIAAFSADGSLSVNNLTVNGTQTNIAGSATALDLGATTGIAAGTGTNFGDKIQLYQSNYGFGVQSNALVAFLPANAGFSVRQKSSSGYASGGADAVVLGSNGSVSATGLATLAGGVDLSTAGGALAAAGTTLGDKQTYYTNTGLGMTDSTHLSLFVPTGGSVLQVAPANTGSGAKSSGLTPGVQLTGSGVGNFKSDVRLNNVSVGRGYLDSGIRTTDSSGFITNEVMMPEHTCTFTAISGHSYRVTLTVGHAGNLNDKTVWFRLRDGTSTGSPQLAHAIAHSSLADGVGETKSTFVFLVQGLSAGVHNLTPSIQGYNGDQIKIRATTTSPNFMLVEHIGGAAQSAL